MKDELSRFLNSDYSHNDPRLYWKFKKFKMKVFSRNYSINEKSVSKKAREQLGLKLKQLPAVITTSSNNSLLKEFEDSKHKLEELYDSITNCLIIRSKVEWYEKGEKTNGAYFFNLEKRKLEELYDIITNGLIIRSKVEWYEKGEKFSGAYFFNLEKRKLEELYDSITNSLIIRSKVEWYEKGEKSNGAYFFNLEKRKPEEL